MCYLEHKIDYPFCLLIMQPVLLVIRYRLKKRFDRGSYGEVWLAFHWDCSLGSDASTWSLKNNNFPFSTIHLGTLDGGSQRGPSTQDCNSSPLDDSMFILKRIMVILFAFMESSDFVLDLCLLSCGLSYNKLLILKARCYAPLFVHLVDWCLI